MKTCPKCGATNDDSAKNCGSCGAELENAVDNNQSAESGEKEQEMQEHDNQDSESVQTEAKKPNKKTAIIAIAAILVCLIAFIATRPKVVSLKVKYKGETQADVVLDDNNPGFIVKATYSDGTTKEVETGKWKIEEPKTLEMDKSSKVTVSYKGVTKDVKVQCSTSKLVKINVLYKGSTVKETVLDENNDGFEVWATYQNGTKKVIPFEECSIKEPQTLKADKTSTVTVVYEGISTDIKIKCTSTVLKYIRADYDGNLYEGTVIDKDSDITVEAVYGNNTKKTLSKNEWQIEPESVTLEKDVESKIKVTATIDGEGTFSAELKITGKEKPFTNPKIEGDHYNCTPDQFVNYLNLNTKLILLPTDNNYFDGDDYSCYTMSGMSSTNIGKTGLALRKGDDEKLSTMIIVSPDTTTGAAEALFFASIFDRSVNTDDRSKLAGLLLYKVFSTDNTVVVMDDDSTSGYVFYIMTKEFFDNNFKQ